MTDKERLEEIKKILEFTLLFFNRKSGNTQFIEDFIWLVEQAERVQELELELNDWKDEVSKWYKRFQESEESHLETKELLYSTISENKRYKQALEFYADEEHYKEKLISEAQYDADGICISNDKYAPPIIYFDSGEKARQALVDC